jgi:hypothetical protein
LFAVAEALPGIRRVELTPLAVIKVAAFVRAAGEVGKAAGSDQQLRDHRSCGCLPFAQSVRQLPNSMSHKSQWAILAIVPAWLQMAQVAPLKDAWCRADEALAAVDTPNG